MHLQRHQGQIRPDPQSNLAKSSQASTSCQQDTKASAMQMEVLDTSQPQPLPSGQSPSYQHQAVSSEPLKLQRQHGQGSQRSGDSSEVQGYARQQPDASVHGDIYQSIESLAGSTSSQHVDLSGQGSISERQHLCYTAEPSRDPFAQQLSEEAVQLGPSISSMSMFSKPSQEEDAMHVDAVVTGVSRLSVAAGDAAIPDSFSFGRRRGRGRMTRGRHASRGGTCPSGKTG